MGKGANKEKKEKIVQWLLPYCRDTPAFESEIMSLYNQKKYKDVSAAISRRWNGASDVCNVLQNSQQVMDIFERFLKKDVEERVSRKRPNTEISESSSVAESKSSSQKPSQEDEGEPVLSHLDDSKIGKKGRTSEETKGEEIIVKAQLSLSTSSSSAFDENNEAPAAKVANLDESIEG